MGHLQLGLFFAAKRSLPLVSVTITEDPRQFPLQWHHCHHAYGEADSDGIIFPSDDSSRSPIPTQSPNQIESCMKKHTGKYQICSKRQNHSGGPPFHSFLGTCSARSHQGSPLLQLLSAEIFMIDASVYTFPEAGPFYKLSYFPVIFTLHP